MANLQTGSFRGDKTYETGESNVPIPLQRNQKMTQVHHPFPGNPADSVPPAPHLNPNNPPFVPMSPADVAALQAEARSMVESARRIEAAARNISAVAQRSNAKLGRKEKVIVAATALGLVSIGVGSTLLVQRMRRGRVNRPMTVVNTK